MVTPEEIQAFFEDRQKRDDDIKELRDEAKLAMESFCSGYGMKKKAVTMAYRLWKEMQKDKHEAESTQFEYDKLAELLITSN